MKDHVRGSLKVSQDSLVENAASEVLGAFSVKRSSMNSCSLGVNQLAVRGERG